MLNVAISIKNKLLLNVDISIKNKLPLQHTRNNFGSEVKLSNVLQIQHYYKAGESIKRK